MGNVTVLPLLDDAQTSLHVFLANDGYEGQDLQNASVDLTVDLPADSALTAAKLWRIDESHTNPKALWEEWGAPNYLKPNQVAELKRAANPVPSALPFCAGSSCPSRWSSSVAVPAFGLAVVELS